MVRHILVLAAALFAVITAFGQSPSMLPASFHGNRWQRT